MLLFVLFEMSGLYSILLNLCELFHVCLVDCHWCDVESGLCEAICLREEMVVMSSTSS